MSVYVDDLINHGTKGNSFWCHMWADELHELQAMADAIGLKRAWIQVREGRMIKYHYDLAPSKRQLALNHGAVYMLASKWMTEQKEKQP